jgi:hypothetical protein
VPRFAPLSVDCNGLLAEREELTDEQWAIIAPPIMVARGTIDRRGDVARPRTGRSWFAVADRDAYMKMAEDFEAGGDLRAAENARGRASLCQAHLIRIDEQFNGEIL